MFTEYNWLPWKFRRVPYFFWDSIENKKKFMDWAGKELLIKDFKDWYEVSHAVILYFSRLLIEKDIVRLGGPGSTPVFELVSSVYPQYKWDISLFNPKLLTKKKVQNLLKRFLKEIFPKEGTFIQAQKNLFSEIVWRSIVGL